MNKTQNPKPQRLRNHQAVIRFADDEWDEFQSRVKATQQTQQAYILNALLHSRISTASEIQEIQQIGHKFGDTNQQLRGACTNLNQMVKGLNRLKLIMETQPVSQQLLSLVGPLPTTSNLNTCILAIQNWRKEMELPWQCLRQYLAHQRPTAGSGTPSNTSSAATK